MKIEFIAETAATIIHKRQVKTGKKFPSGAMKAIIAAAEGAPDMEQAIHMMTLVTKRMEDEIR